MTKHLLTAALLGSMALSAAAESSIVFTYANDEIDSWGKAKAEKIDVAMCINNPALAGKKITSVRALINKDDGVDVISLWLSKELTLENKVNAPDICSMDSPQMTEIPVTSDWTVTQLDAALPEPYVITDEPVYVGYSIDVTTNKTNAEKYPIVLSNASNPEGFYLHASKSVLKWKDYTSTLDAVAAIYVTLEGDFQPYSLGLNDIPYSYAEVNEPYEVAANVMNIGSEEVNSIDYTYTVGDKTATGHLELLSPVQTDYVNSSVVMLPLEPVGAIGVYDAVLTIDKVNGQDNVTEAPTASFQVCVMPFVPVHRPLVEEFTGMWCGWCTRGYVAMELFRELYHGKVIGLAYHNDYGGEAFDPLTVTRNYPVNVGGFPSASIDRGAVVDPYYGASNSEFGISVDVNQVIATMPEGDIYLEGEWNEDKTEYTVTTDVRFVRDIENANYQVGYVLGADGFHDAGWYQSNYYSGRSETGYLAEVCAWPSTVYDLVYNDVAVDVNACRGVAGSIPASVVAGEHNISSYTFTVGDSFKNIKKEVIPFDKDKMFVAAFIIDKNKGAIVNANKIYADSETGVEGVAVDDDADAPVEYFNLNGIKVANPENGIFIRRQGSRTSKVAL